jgi:hypothetical protein
MADGDDPEAAAARLAAALEKIAQSISRPRPPPEIATRLDALIAQIRRTLQRAEE